MAGHSAKNYRKSGGSEWVIGGKLTFESGASISGGAATTAKAGVVKQAAAVANAAGAAPTAAEFNALVAALKAAGIMAST